MKIFKEIDKLKAEIDSLRPLSEDFLKQLKAYFKIGLTYSSNALEGNSLLESETKVVLEDGITINGKPLRDHYEAVGHAEAFDLMLSLSEGKNITEEDIKNLHRLFYKKIDDKTAGTYRTNKVIITGSRYNLPPPEKINFLMNIFIKELSSKREKLHPVEFSAIVHKEFVFIHPFVDGNGRVARLLMNLCLIQDGYTIALISPVLRAEYIQILEKAHENDGTFIEFIAKSVKETQKDYLRLLKN